MRTQLINAAHLKEAIDPIEFYTAEGQEIATKGCSPWKLGGLCPFHRDRHAGTFYIHDVTGAYSCFSCETTGGDIIDFTQRKYGLTFVEAIKRLASAWRVS